ncbi:hypothetical protein [Bradyrhizobium sp. DOA1]|uniref:hypothetical protein n=1 Tax=Bradyrhizobium sp. DOA1 TaxID=1126616 RepID=UPI000A42C2A4|nr:hypothetical protein [Bradyrhizobium sp. DOA1]
MRIPSSNAGAGLETDLHAARGGKKGAHTRDPHDEHDRSPSASGPVNAASNPDSGSHDAALRQAFNVALGAVAFQLANNAMTSFQDTMAETEENS